MAQNDPGNSYDSAGIIKRLGLMRAGGLKLAAYRVRDPETKEYGATQFHMTFNDCVMAVMGEQSAKLFCQFVQVHADHPSEIGGVPIPPADDPSYLADEDEENRDSAGLSASERDEYAYRNDPERRAEQTPEEIAYKAYVEALPEGGRHLTFDQFCERRALMTQEQQAI